MNDNRLIIRDGDVDTALVAEYESSRRDLVRRGLVVGGAAISAAAIPTLWNVRNAFAQADGDAAILGAAIGLEQTAVVAYDTAAQSGLLGPATAVAELFRDQEQEHADALIAALEGLGGTAPKPPAAADVAGLGDVKNATDILNFAVELENSAVAAYVDATKKLESADLLKAGAQIISNEGQHLVVLRQALGTDPVPSAFPSGNEGV